jgi:hypothetical protein
MRERSAFRNRYRVALIGGAVVVIGLQVALYARARGDETEGTSEAGSTAQLVQLPESEAPLQDVAELLTPEPQDDHAPTPRAEATTLASLPSVPRLTAAMAEAMQPIMFMEELDQPDAEENPAVSYASVSDFLISATANPQPLRPIDDRPVAVLATIGNSRQGIGIGGDGPHCKPARPGMFRRSAVVSGVPSRILPRR